MAWNFSKSYSGEIQFKLRLQSNSAASSWASYINVTLPLSSYNHASMYVYGTTGSYTQFAITVVTHTVDNPFTSQTVKITGPFADGRIVLSQGGYHRYDYPDVSTGVPSDYNALKNSVLAKNSLYAHTYVYSYRNNQYVYNSSWYEFELISVTGQNIFVSDTLNKKVPSWFITSGVTNFNSFGEFTTQNLGWNTVSGSTQYFTTGINWQNSLPLFYRLISNNYSDIKPEGVKGFDGFDWKVYIDGTGKEAAITIAPEIPDDVLENLTVDEIQAINNITLNISTVKPFPTLVNAISPFNESVTYYGGKFTQYPCYTSGGKLNQDQPLIDKENAFYVSYVKDGEIIGIIGASIDWTDNTNTATYNLNGDKGGSETDSSTLTFIYGTYKSDDDENGDGGNNGSKDDPNSDGIPDSTGYNTLGVLTKTYAMTINRLQQLGSKLWGSSFVDNIKLMNNSPIENIVSIKAMPFDMSGSDQEIVLGNVSMGVNGALIPNSHEFRTTVGSIQINGRYNSFLDYAPFTKITIFLPFIGYKELDANMYTGRTLRVDYIHDIVTGACKAVLYANDNPVNTFDGSIGIDVPIAASNRAQIEAGYVATFTDSVASGFTSGGALGGIEGAVAGTVSNAFSQFHTQQGGGISPTCSAYMTRSVFVIIDSPSYQNLQSFNHTYGRMCMLTRSIGGLSGYTKTTKDVDLSGVNATEQEKEMLVSILSSGFFA